MEDFFEKAKRTVSHTMRRWTSDSALHPPSVSITVGERQDGFMQVELARRSSVTSSPLPADPRPRGRLQSYSPDVKSNVLPSSHPRFSPAMASPNDMRSAQGQHLSSHPSSVPASPSLRERSHNDILSPGKDLSRSSSTRTSPQTPQFQSAPLPKETSKLPSIVSSPAQGVSHAPSASREPPPLSSQKRLLAGDPPPAPPASVLVKKLAPQNLDDPFNLWTFTPEELSFVLDTLPKYQRGIHSNLAQAYEWIWAITPKKEGDANSVAEFDNLCADILKIKKNILKKQTKKSSYEPLFNPERTYSILYSIFSFQYMGWNGKDSTPVIQSYKNVVDAIWKILTVDRNIPLSSKYSLLNYVLFLAESNPIHKSFRPFSDPIFRNPSVAIFSPARRSFWRARQKHALPTDLTIIKRCLRQEDDEFQRRTYLCTPKFRDLSEDEKIRNAFFHNLTFFQTNPAGEFSSQFHQTYLYLYALVDFETIDLTNSLDRAQNKIYNNILDELYRFYTESYPSQPDFYASLLSFQAREFPTLNVHAYFDQIHKSMNPVSQKGETLSPLSPSNPGPLSRHRSTSLGALHFKDFPS
ncbi:MAG TPA: hypothetical protein PLY23_06510 [Alphaproteobacteria bacterium]|nr:hypothetical protein [Alphaproteobacteria bacterium]HQS94329.1 hypothetical protein [Alphaproteobacteria bacterium]